MAQLQQQQQNTAQPDPSTQRYRRPLIQQPTTDSSIISVSRAPDGSLVPKYQYQQPNNVRVGMPSVGGNIDGTVAAAEVTIGTDNSRTTVSTLENVSSTQNFVRGKRGK